MEVTNSKSNNTEKDRLLGELLNWVLKNRLQPEDKFEIAAMLESHGWNDGRASETFGVADIFELAEILWDNIQKKIVFAPFKPSEKLPLGPYLLMMVKSFLRGTIFALPMAVSVVAMLTIKFSLWSYLNLSLELATSIAIGTIMSFVTVGGFTQAIARRGFLYIKQGYYNMARRIVFYFVRLGYMVCFFIAVLFLIFNAFFGVFPFIMTLVIILYYFFLSAIWLSVTIMYILEREFTFTILITVGIGIVYVLFIILHLDIIVSQIIALAIIAVIGISLALYFFISAERKMEKGIAPALPRTSIIIYTVLPYFIYGFLYFSFLFIDRIIAWSASSIYMPYLIWFRGPYELGLDLALLTLIIPMGFIEVVVNEIMINLEANKKEYLSEESGKLNWKYMNIYLKRAVVVLVFSLICAVFIYFVVKWMDTIPTIHTGVMDNRVSHFVFTWALLAYSLICISLMNCLILFSLSQPVVVGQIVLSSLILNVIIGFPLSRWLDYQYAVLGLLAGTILFVVLSTREVIRVLKKLDYYLYAAA